MNKYDTFNKAILYTIDSYIRASIKDGLEPSPLHFRIMGATKAYMTFNPLHKEDISALKSLAGNESLKRITSVKVSFLVYTLELIKQFIEQVPKEYRPFLNISDKKLIIGRGSFAVGMLKLKQKDKEKHAELTEIINDRIVTAKHFFDFHLRELVKNEKAVA